MGRLLEALQLIVQNDRVIQTLDATLLCLGLTCTAAAFVPLLTSARARVERSVATQRILEERV